MDRATARPTLRPSFSQLLGPIRQRLGFKGSFPRAKVDPWWVLPGRQDGGLWPDDLTVHVAIPVHVVEEYIYPDAMVQLPDGVELTLSELQDMASRQQQQIESHQQMLVAKEQRLKFLKQQELQHQQMTSENERLRRLRERVEAQELKLRKLRALRGQVDQQKMSNSSLTSELESIRALFNEKEKELSVAVAKVEELTQQLEEVRRGRLSNQVLGGSSSPAMIELEKLRRELLYRNKLNEQQNNKLAQQREALSRGQEEMNRIDRRIAELQQRLHRKRMHNQQLANQINAVTSAKQAQLRSNQSRNRTRPLSANIAAVEPFKHVPNDVSAQPALTTTKSGVQQERAQDDLHPKLSSAKTEDLPEFQPNKNDPKYQTLPVNTKFLVKLPKPSDGEEVKTGNGGGGGVSGTGEVVSKKTDDKPTVNVVNSSTPGGGTAVNGKMPPATQTVHSIPTYTPPKGHAMPVAHQLPLHQPSQNLPQLMPTKTNMSAKPFSTTYSSSILITPIASTGPSAPKYIPPPAPPPNSIEIPVLRPSSNLPNTPLTAPNTEKPTSSVAPTTLQPSRIPLSIATSAPHTRPSPIYQTSSTRVTPITPHTLSATPQGLLRDMTEDPPSTFAVSVSASRNQTVNDTVQEVAPQSAAENYVGDGNTEDSPAKPILPPKPTIPQKPTPPPRQIHSHGGAEKGKVDTSPGAVDSALNILRGSQGAKGSGNYRYASRNVITDTYTQKLSSNSLNQYLRNMTHTFGRSDGESAVPTNSSTGSADADASVEGSTLVSSTDEGGDNENGTKKSSTNNDLPIKPKPLTIKKNSGVEPPKLKVLTNGNTGPGSPRKQSPPLEGTPTNNNTTNNNNNVSNVSCNNSGNLGNNRAVHISINKRIEMPPAFLFPENETPPPDLNVSRDSHTVVNVNTSSDVKSDVPDNVVKIPPPPPGPPPYPLVEGDKAWDAAKSWSEKKRHPVITTDSAPADDQLSPDNVGNNQNNEAESNSDFTPVTTTTPVITTTTITSSSEGDVDGNINNSTGPLTLSVHDVNEADASSSSSSPNSSSGDPQTLITVRRGNKGNLKTKRSTKAVRRVSFDPLALLLDASLEGELELVRKTAREVPNPSAANDEGITALHNAICAGHYEIVKFLVEFGCDVNAQDSDGWTPLHCAASCNNLPMVKFLVEHGACIFATTLSDHETAAEKCEEDEEGFDGCSEYLYSIQEKLGILNNGAVYALYDYEAHNSDELSFSNGDMIVVLRKGDEFEREWWWSRFKNQEGYIPRNLLGLYPRVSSKDA